MKGSVIFVVSIVLAVGAGFGGGFAAASLHSSSVNVTSVPTINDFKLLRSVIEKGGDSGNSFYLNASEGRTPYQAGFQVILFNGSHGFTLASGSFFGSLNFTPLSLIEILIFSSLSPGNYTLVATVMHGDMSSSTDASLKVLPHVSATISGPNEVNDSKGPVSEVYYAHLKGGVGPYYYTWSIFNESYTQEAKLGSNTSSSLQITFFKNEEEGNFYGNYNGTMYIQLTITDSLGYQFSLDNLGYEVNLTGY